MGPFIGRLPVFRKNQAYPSSAVVLDKGGASAAIIGEAFWDPNSKFAIVCTKARYNRHFIGSYWRSTNQSSKLIIACNVL